MAALSEDDLKRYQGGLERAGQFKLGEHIVTSAMVEIKPQQKRLTGRCLPSTGASALSSPGRTHCQSGVPTPDELQDIWLHAVLVLMSQVLWQMPSAPGRWYLLETKALMHSGPQLRGCPTCGCLTCRNFTPSVIEPSFGIGRILYCMFEHTYYARPDDAQARLCC